jgi:hypothetical protein
MRILSFVCLLISSFASCGFVQADIFINNSPPGSSSNKVPTVADTTRWGWTRGASNTTFSGWGSFTDDSNPTLIVDSTPDGTGGAAPFLIPFNSTGPTATIQELSGTAFLTSGFNIYSPTTVTSFQVDQTGLNLGSGYNTTVVALWRTVGSQLQYGGVDGIRLTGTGFTDVAPTYTETLYSAVNPGFGGFQIEYLARWDLVGNFGDYTMEFQSAASSMSLDQFSIDTAVTAVPEPTSMLLGAVGLAVPIARRWRRCRTELRTS